MQYNNLMTLLSKLEIPNLMFAGLESIMPQLFRF